MSPSIGNIEKKKKRGRGRPPTAATPVMVRVLPAQLEELDRWAHAEKVGRPEAIRRLLAQALKKKR
jgi:Ribbon-helix-helix protein, copG family